jgi:hypothetical protein
MSSADITALKLILLLTIPSFFFLRGQKHKKMERKEIGNIGNYYGGLNVMEFEGKYYWCIEDYNTDLGDLEDWDEIDKELYDSLIAFQERLEKKEA